MGWAVSPDDRRPDQEWRRDAGQNGGLDPASGLAARTLLYQGGYTFIPADEAAARLVFKVEGNRATGFTLTSVGQASEATQLGNETAGW
ncbi:MAG: hypothetical protein ABR543_12155 [Gemmatimonadaceae bacterium]